MSNYVESRRKILELIKEGKVKAEDGFRLIKKLDKKTEPTGRSAPKVYSKSDIAIIGISGKFPDADNLDEFWDNLYNGRNSIKEIPPERWSIEELYSADRKAPGKSYSKWGGFLKDAANFDPLFFNISPREAEYMDPQQRLYLEECWKALEDAGYSDKKLNGLNCGVFTGAEPGDYLNRVRAKGELSDSFIAMGNAGSILSARIAYYLNLKGPAITVDTACSSSLVALHLACESIMAGTCSIAIAGGVTIHTTAEFYIMTSKANMLSPTGQCHTFDNRADGFVPGEGVGVVIIKPLKQAIEDNDHIYGVIKASHINQDGKTNGITAPSSPSQTALECEVYDKSGISPESISYIEAHGTGTKLGDPIEINALTDSFRKYTTRKQFCAIGSVKTNIGHTIAAAGIAGLLKILLSLKHKQLPPSINFQTPNEHIDFANSPLYVNNKLSDWQTGTNPRRAALSSFGFSGTNAHLLIEEWPASKAKRPPHYSSHLILLSATNDEALKNKIIELIRWLEKSDDTLRIADLAYTLGARRTHFSNRRALVTNSKTDLIIQLKELTANEDFSQKSTGQSITDVKNLTAKVLNTIARIASGTLPHQTVENSLKVLATLYMEKAHINWNKLYSHETYNCLSLPAYPFARERYWISAELEKSPERKITTDNEQDVGTVIKQLVAETIKVDIKTVNENSSLEEYGIDSIILMELIQKIGKRFKLELKLSDIHGLDKINDWINYIKSINSVENSSPESNVSETIKEMISETLKVNSKHLDDSIPLEDFGIDSIILMELIQKIGKRFKLELKLSDIHGLDTINCWEKYITLHKKENSITGNDSFEIDTEYVNKIENKYKYAFRKCPDEPKIAFIKSSKNLNIEYFMSGEGQPLLLLPPFFGTATSWMFQIPKLVKNYKVIAFHYPGCGRSEFNAELSSFDEICANIVENIKALHIKPPLHILSWSMGGFIAQKLAVTHPQLIKSLVLVNTSSNTVQEDRVENVVKMSNDLAHDFNSNFPKNRENEKESIMNSIKGSYNNEISIHYVYEAFKFNYTSELNKIKAPTLIVGGGKDKLYSPAHSEAMNKAITGSEYESIKSAGHYIPVNNEKYFNKLLLAFLKKHK